MWVRGRGQRSGRHERGGGGHELSVEYLLYDGTKAVRVAGDGGEFARGQCERRESGDMRVVDTLGSAHGPGCRACRSAMWIGRRGAGMAVSPITLMGARELTIQVCHVW